MSNSGDNCELFSIPQFFFAAYWVICIGELTLIEAIQAQGLQHLAARDEETTSGNVR